MNYIDPQSIINRSWWLLMLQGALAALFGLAVLFDPGAQFVRIAVFVAAFWMLGGLFDMFGGLFRYGADPDWWIAFVAGFIGIGCGAILLTHAGALLTGPPAPGGRMLAAPIALGTGLGATVAGLANLAAGVRLRARTEAGSMLWGLLQMIVGAWLAGAPVIYDVLTVIAVVGTFAIIGGISLAVFGFRMKWVRGGGGGSAPMSGGSRRREG